MAVTNCVVLIIILSIMVYLGLTSFSSNLQVTEALAQQLPPVPPSLTDSQEQPQSGLSTNITSGQQNITESPSIPQLQEQQQSEQQALPLLSVETINVSDVTFETYENPDLGVRIEYPSTWRVSEDSPPDYTQIVSFYSPLEDLSDSLPVQVTVSRNDYAQNITQEDYTALTLNTTQSLGINAAASNVSLSERPAHQLITSIPGDQIRPGVEILQVWSVKDNSVYIVTYTADTNKFSKYLPVVNHTISSFRVDNWMGQDH